MNNAQKITPEDILSAIEPCKGNVAAIARKLGVVRGTVYNHIKANIELQEALNDAREEMVDYAESALYSNVMAGDNVAIIFFLKTRGRDRGYSERVELNGFYADLSKAGNEDNKLDLSKLSRDELQTFSDLCEKAARGG